MLAVSVTIRGHSSRTTVLAMVWIQPVYANIPNMDTMTLTISLPKDVGTALENKAKMSRRNATEYVEYLVTKEVSKPSFDEILAPIREGFKKSGMTELELETLIDGEIKAMRAEKRQKRDLENVG